ncbi:hypothetical protein IFO70_25650 [Phormidium tenue FACHB-886]|nr:hypothetical protein [Phormidium tenue FACHB-886]
MSSLLTLAVIAVYVGGVWKFWTGFHRTNFSQGKLYLALLWPVFLVSKSYRQNFNRALKGR